MTAKWAEEKAREILRPWPDHTCERDLEERIAAALKEAEAQGREAGLESALEELGHLSGFADGDDAIDAATDKIRALKSGAANEGKKMCEQCGKYLADPILCSGCEAYKEHQT